MNAARVRGLEPAIHSLQARGVFCSHPVVRGTHCLPGDLHQRRHPGCVGHRAQSIEQQLGLGEVSRPPRVVLEQMRRNFDAQAKVVAVADYCGDPLRPGCKIRMLRLAVDERDENGAGCPLMKTFSDKVRDIVRKIPKGKTMTYKAVAAKAGNPKAARSVGAIMRTNYDPSIPCHRVIASDGSMRGYVRPRRRPAQQ